jgi:hypothetical protein
MFGIVLLGLAAVGLVALVVFALLLLVSDENESSASPGETSDMVGADP